MFLLITLVFLRSNLKGCLQRLVESMVSLFPAQKCRLQISLVYHPGSQPMAVHDVSQFEVEVLASVAEVIRYFDGLTCFLAYRTLCNIRPSAPVYAKGYSFACSSWA